MKKLLIILSAALALIGCQSDEPQEPVAVQACCSIPEGRAAASACSAGGKGYVFGGRDQEGLTHNDLWEYDPKTDSWKKIDTPLSPRVNAFIIGVGTDLYLGMGFNGKAYNDSSYRKDWWRYNIVDGTWTQLKSFNHDWMVHPVGFYKDGQIHVVSATSSSCNANIHYYYDITLDSCIWYPWNDLRGYPGNGAFGATCKGKFYVGGGHDYNTPPHWAEVELDNDIWTQHKTYKGERALAGCTADDQYIYLFGGRHLKGELTGGCVYNDVQRYDPDNDTWTTIGTMPYGEAENMVAFTIDNHVYFGLGEDKNGQLHQELYRMD